MLDLFEVLVIFQNPYMNNIAILSFLFNHAIKEYPTQAGVIPDSISIDALQGFPYSHCLFK